MKAYSTHYQRFTPPYFKGIVCLFVALGLVAVEAWGAEEYTVSNNNKTLTIHKAGDFANGVMTNYQSGSSSLWKTSSNKSNITKIIIDPGITHVGTYAFEGFNAVTSITIPTSVTSFGSDAFKNCSNVTKLYYEGSPNEWANIDFDNQYSHPCGARNGGSDYYFYGENTRTDLLIFEPTIIEIKPYTFQRCSLHSNLTGAGLSIPGTIERIGTKAFYAASFNGEIAINKQNAPTLGTDAFNTAGNNYTIYVPNNASGYTSANGWNHFSTFNKKSISGSDIGSEISTTTNITWNLNESGVLTLNNISGENKAITGIDGADQLPWRYFRRLVYLVKLQGGITALNNMLHYNYGLGGIELSQEIIPSVNNTYIATNSNTEAYTQLSNKRDQLKLRVKPETLLNITEVAKLSSSPWSDQKPDDTKWWQVGLSEPVVLADNTDNGELLGAVKKYVELPFEVQFGQRTLTNEQYNTFCSPVPMSAAQITEVFGGADIRTLVSSEYNAETKELTLYFSESSLTEIEAGKPYLIQPTNKTENPRFTNIAPSAIVTESIDATTEFVDFKGVLAPTALTGGNKNTLFLGAGNELFWPESTGNLNGFRAYFKIKGAAAQAAKRARISMGGKIATGIENPSPALPSREGVKILRDGKLYLMYKGQMYDVQGRRI